MCTYFSCLRFRATHSCCWHCTQQAGSSPVKKKQNRGKNQNYLFPCISTLKTKRKAWLLRLLERSTSSGIPDSFCYDNRHLYSKHHFLFHNASLAETLPSPVSRAVKSPTQIVFNRFLGILGFSYLNPGILDFNGKFGRDSGLKVSRKVVCPPPPKKTSGLRDYTKFGVGITGLNIPIGNPLLSQ